MRITLRRFTLFAIAHATLRQLPAGEYTVQAVLNVYTQVTRADGHTLWVHWDQGEGQHWNISPGNLVSEPTKVRRDPKSTTALRVTITREPGCMFGASWLQDDMPRYVAITWQHPTPWYDDSYAVNSVNTGPYQDVLLNELVPELEKRYRLNLDPVDFRRNQFVDNYADTNAFTPNSDTSPVPVRQMSQREAVLGTKARRGQQFDAFDVRYGPVGQDGYPRRLWDRRTGTIDTQVATYWRDHFDLTRYLTNNWPKIGPSLTGKLHTYVGDMDHHHLQLAVHRMEEDVAKLDGPTPNAELVKMMEKYRQDRVVRP